MHNSDDSQLSRALNAALEHAASQVDWPALNDHLAARLKATHRVRRSPGLILDVAGRLTVAAALLFAAVQLAHVGFGKGTHTPTRPLRGPVLTGRANEVRNLMNELPADETWFADAAATTGGPIRLRHPTEGT